MQSIQAGTPLPPSKKTEDRSFTRGYGSLTLTGETPEEIQERRLRALEYQKEIEQQMEEARKRRAEEKERKLREEQEEERKLELERQRLQQEYEQEQERQKQKEEQKQKKRELLIAAMQEAQASAEAAKKASKQKKFTSPSRASCYSSVPTEAPSNTYASFPSPQSKDGRLASSLITKESHHPLPMRSEHQPSLQSPPSLSRHKSTPLPDVVNPPSSITCASSSDRKEFAVQANLEPSFTQKSGYVENRILTPSKLRIQSRYAGSLPSNLHCICQAKDFGTQTETSYLVGKWIRRDDDKYLGSEESSAESLSHCQNGFSIHKPLRRVQHSKPTRVTSNNHQANTFAPYGDAPSIVNKWVSGPFRSLENGGQHLNSSFYKRKKLQEMRKQHWEREMATRQKKGILEVSRHSQTVSFSPSSEESGENSLETDSIPIRSPSPTSMRNGYARPSSPPVPALQKKLGLESPQIGSTISVTFRNHQHQPINSIVPSPLSSKDNSHCPPYAETRPKSPPVPALRKKLESTAKPPPERRFPQPVPTASLRRQWSHSTESLPTIPGRDQRLSLPLHLAQTLSSSSGSSSSGSGYGRYPIRRRWHSQENFHPDNFLAKSSSSVTRVHPREHLATAPPSTTKNPGTNVRRKWETDHENLNIIHKALSSNPISDDEDSENQAPKIHTDPLINPDLVRGRPTPRQDRILQQLTDLRQGLLKKQKELESLLQPSANSS